MSAEIINGKMIAAQIKASVRQEAEAFYQRKGRKMGLAVVLVGEDGPSQIYVKNKIAACEQCFIESFAYRLPESTTEDFLIDLIKKMNADERIDAMLIQLPLPAHMRQNHVLSFISPEKDADGFLAVNAGNLMLGNPSLNACTPCGIIELIQSTGRKISGTSAVVVGRSNIVGKPTALLLLENDATVTMCHSKTKHLKEITLHADILVSAVGKKNLITADMVKKGAIVIDVGMNRDERGLSGDVDFENVKEVAGYITPVPGGVGPMTVAMLMRNISKAAQLRE